MLDNMVVTPIVDTFAVIFFLHEKEKNDSVSICYIPYECIEVYTLDRVDQKPPQHAEESTMIYLIHM